MLSNSSTVGPARSVPTQYERYVLPASRKVLEGVANLGVPRIHFGVNTGELLGLMREAGADVVGVDWRTPLATARARVGGGVALQGNLDPAVCFAPWTVVADEVRAVLADNDGHPGPHLQPRSRRATGHRPDGVGTDRQARSRRGPGGLLTTGVVVMAYGTPASADEVEAYYTHIRRGRPPTVEQLDDLRSRYDAIGGLSPLREITHAQRDCLAAVLGDGYQVELGYKHASPFIEDAVAALPNDVVGLVLAPHYSRGSIGEYVERLGHPAIESWHDLPEWRSFQAQAVRAALNDLPRRTHVLFTAHSLPERVLADDIYPDELLSSATAIATEAGLAPGSWSLAWQSAGRTPEPWRGPDVLEVIADLDADGVLVCPQGFTADHLEVLYDLDIAAQHRADKLGIAFARTAMINDDARVLGALADRVRSFPK